MEFRNKRSGYTFFEIMAVIFILILFGTFVLLNLPIGLRNKMEIDNAIDNIKNHLVLVQQRAISQENGARWGIHFDATVSGRNFYQIFYGDSYETGTIVETVYLPYDLVFLSPPQGGYEDVIFEKVTGHTLYGHSIVIGFASDGSIIYDNTNSSSITIAADTGLAQKMESVPDFNFTVSSNPASATIQAGQTALTSVKIDILSGISKLTSLSASDLPSGTTASFSAISCLPTCVSDLTLRAGQNIPNGSYPVIISGTSGNLVRSVNFILNINTKTPPGAPDGLSASAGNRVISLSWQAPSYSGGSPVTNYKIYRGDSSGSEVFLANAGNALSYSDNGLPIGTSYYYRISAVNSIGESVLSQEIFSTTFNIPSAPNNLLAAGGLNKITLNWQAPASDGGSPVTNYKIYRGTSSGGEVFLANAGNAYAYIDSGVSKRTTYYYKISAENAIGTGPQSQESGSLAALRAFVTKNRYSGARGGMTGVDNLCQSLGGPSGTWKAWLSNYLGPTASSRLSHYAGPYVKMNGARIANDWNGLVSGSLLSAIDIDESGAGISLFYGDVWTNTTPSGNWSWYNDCNQWYAASNAVGGSGNVGSLGGGWTDYSQTNSCFSFYHFYCFEQ